MSDLPSPPFVTVDGIANFRDIGGYPISSQPSTSIKRHLLYRSADPSPVTPAGKATLQSLGITTVFDLRSKPEVDRSLLGAPLDIPGMTRHFTPVFPDQDGSPEALALRYKDYAHGGVEGFTRAYLDILESGSPAFRTVFLHLRDKPAEPCLFHCSVGKDRTGVLGALILKLVGVDDDVVAREYELTERGITPLRPAIVQHLLENPSLQGNEEAVLRMVGSKYENMIATLELLETKYGGVERYLSERCSLSTQDIEAIRKNLVVDEKAIL